MPVSSPFRVLVVGAGLGGLCLAQSLRPAGIEVQVVERDTTLWDRPQGYRLHLEADALAALREVLSAERHALFEATAMRTTPYTTVLSPGLDVRRRLLTDDDQDHTVFPDYHTQQPEHRNVDRAILREILLDGLDDRLSFGKQLLSYTSTADGVDATFSDGTTTRADVLVGADGIRSAVRAVRAPGLATMDAGVQAIYGRIPWATATALVPAEALSDIFTIAIDDKKVFLGLGAVKFPTEPQAAAVAAARPGLLTRRDDYVVCIVGGRHERFPITHRQLRIQTSAQIQQAALAVIEDWPEQARAAVAAGEPGSFFSVDMYSSVPGSLDRPTNVTLLGDAVHAMTPTLGRGANLALRDAALLGRALKAAADKSVSVADALAGYEAGLIEYGFSVVRESVAMGEQRMNQNPLPTTMTGLHGGEQR